MRPGGDLCECLALWMGEGEQSALGLDFLSQAQSPKAEDGSQESIPFFSSVSTASSLPPFLCLNFVESASGPRFPPPLLSFFFFHTAHGSCRVVGAGGWRQLFGCMGSLVPSLCESGAVCIYHKPPPGKMFSSTRVCMFPAWDHECRRVGGTLRS